MTLILVGVLAFLLAAPARAVPSWCQLVREYDYWLVERGTQRGPWKSLSAWQKAYYRDVDRKMLRAHKEAVRLMGMDQSAVAQQIFRDIAFLNTFSHDLPYSVRYKYKEASFRKQDAIQRTCGFYTFF